MYLQKGNYMPARRDIEIGPGIDLETEEVYLSDGTRLTEKRGARIAEEAVAKHPARVGRWTLPGQLLAVVDEYLKEDRPR